MADTHQPNVTTSQTHHRADVEPLADTPMSTQSHEPEGRRRWPLLLIGASAGTATWSGWVGLGELTGFGVVHPLPGIWDDLTLNTAITLPIGVEAYAVYALAVATDPRPMTRLARRWAWASASGALLLGMGGQIAYHLLAARDLTTAPAWVVALVSSLPVLVLGAASLLWHLAAIDPAPGSDLDDTAADGHRPAPGARPARSAVGVSVTVVPDRAPAVPSGGVRPYPAPVPVEADHDRRHTPELSTASAPAPTAVSGAPAPSAVSTVVAVSGAVASRGPNRPRGARTTLPVPAASDEVLLAQLAALSDDEDLPSIRALMRDHALGQARATRIHREATARRDQRRDATDLGGRGDAASPENPIPAPGHLDPTGSPNSAPPQPSATTTTAIRMANDEAEAHETDEQNEHQASETTTEEKPQESSSKIHN